MTSQPRDSQRSRVYRAETPLGGRRLPTLADCAGYRDEVIGSLWWLARFPDRDLFHAPRLRPGHGARQAFYREEGTEATITLPRRYRTTGVILHELVHWALADAHDLPNHGRTFTRVLLDAAAEFLGPAKRERLAAGYAEHKVNIARPPRRSPDGRFDYAWDERLRLGRGRTLTVWFDGGAPVTGVLLSRAHLRLRLRTADGERTVPERDVWRVAPEPAPHEDSITIAIGRD